MARTLLSTLKIAAACAMLPMILAGCGGKPSAANTQLRKDMQGLQAKVDELQRQRSADVLTINSLKDASGPATEKLSEERLAELFTTHSIAIGRGTAGDDSDPSSPGYEGFTMLLMPSDQHNDVFKAAGNATVQLFDLSRTDKPLLGKWDVSRQELGKTWIAGFTLQGYLLKFKWQEKPKTGRLMLRVTFADQLTGRVFEAQHEMVIQP